MKHSRISLVERAAEFYDFGFAAPRLPAGEASAAPPASHEADTPDEQTVTPQVALQPAAVPTPQPGTPQIDEVAAREGIADLGSHREAQSRAPVIPTPARQSAPDRIDREALAAAGFIVPGGTVSALEEEMRLVKHRLLASIDRRTNQPEEKRRCVLVSSAQAGEGKTFCALNLALSLAGERDVEVLLVDGDFSKPDIASILGIEPGPGLVDALIDSNLDPQTLVIDTDIAGLKLLPAGRKVNNVPELLASERTRDVLVQLVGTDHRRIILFDSPPVLMASCATVLANHVGQSLVIVRADHTTEADLRETIGLLSGCDHVGLVLNAAQLAVSGRKFGLYGEGGSDAL
jgi:Mrp family chromosome partitioning ATPase